MISETTGRMMTGNAPGVAMPLSMMAPGQTARVAGFVEAGRGMTQKLVAMGILPDVQVTMLGSRGGPVMLRIGEGRLALGRGIAQRIMVRLGA